MSSTLTIQQFPCLRNLADFATDCDPTDTLEKTCRVGASFFFVIPALITDLLLYLPLEAYNSRLCVLDSSDLEIELPFDKVPTRPISDAAHLQQSIDHALNTWPARQAEAREAIQNGLMDDWNVFQMTAEWSIA